MLSLELYWLFIIHILHRPFLIFQKVREVKIYDEVKITGENSECWLKFWYVKNVQSDELDLQEYYLKPLGS